MINGLISYNQLKNKSKYKHNIKVYLLIALVTFVSFILFSYYTINDERFGFSLIIVIYSLLNIIYFENKNDFSINTKYISIPQYKVIIFNYIKFISNYFLFIIIIIMFNIYILGDIEFKYEYVVYTIIGFVYLNLASPAFFRTRDVVKNYLYSIVVLVLIGGILNYSIVIFPYTIYIIILVCCFILSIIYSYYMLGKMLQPKNYTK